MADITDVADALVDVVVARLFPNGPGGANAYPVPVKVYAGWPDAQQLEKDLRTGGDGIPAALHVSVWKLPMERDTTRFNKEWLEAAIPAATYSLAILGNTVTVSGSAPNPHDPQNVALGVYGFHHAYVHTAAASETAAQVAAALGALVAVDIPGVVVSGADITIPQPYRIMFARLGVIGSARRELARSETGFQVTVWANNHDQRTALAKRLEPRLADIVFLKLADGSSARLTRRGSNDLDAAQAQGAYRRDLVYSVEYAITETVDAPQIVAVEVQLQEPGGTVIAETLE